MNNIDYNNCRLFLEAAISNDTKNIELIKAYVVLIEKKTEFDISYFNGDAELRKDWEKNQTERMKSEAEVRKTSIEKNVY